MLELALEWWGGLILKYVCLFVIIVVMQLLAGYLRFTYYFIAVFD